MTENNKRKLRVWDSSALTKIYNDTFQFKTTIEEMYINSEVEKIDELPNSLVPTDLLFDICTGFLFMYEKMLEENLIKSGFPKPVTIIH
jgi:hypothetical protein